MTGVSGLAVLAVMLASTGGFRAELLGANLVLAVSGYLTTRALLDAASSRLDGRMRLDIWYRDHFKHRVPLALFTLAVTLGLAALFSPPEEARRLAMAAVAGLAQLGNWCDLFVVRAQIIASHGDWYADRPGQIDPLGTIWLLSLIEQFALLWPILLGCIRWFARRIGGRSAPPDAAIRTAWLTASACLLLAAVACLVGPLRAAAGADLAELALGSHVRVAEWLLGAAAAGLVVAARTRAGSGVPVSGASVSGAPDSAAPDSVAPDSAALAEFQRARPARGVWWATIGGVIGVAVLVADALIATAHPADWLRGAGPSAAAGGAALLLATVDRQVVSFRHGPIEWLLARGGPVELGRMAYPLLLLHLPVFWLLRQAFPTARPDALLLVGGGFAWFVGLLLQDGLVGRLRVRRWRVRWALPVLLLAGVTVATSSTWLPAAAEGQLRTDRGPVLLALGGSFAGDLAVTLGSHDAGRYSVVDATLPGCGLYPVPPPAVQPARVTADAQLPPSAPTRSAACMNWAEQWRTRITQSRPEALVVDLSTDAAARLYDGSVISPCDVEYRQLYRQELDRAAQLWAALAPGRPVLLTDVRSVTGEADPASSRCFNALIIEAVARYPQVLLLDVEAALCQTGQCWTRTSAGKQLYFDAVHLTPAGMDSLAPWLGAAVGKALAPGPPTADSAAGGSPAGGPAMVDDRPAGRR
ncbi:SGNH hydrolase domain-containing protein [Frankia sp. Cr2]|uniref:SGNH hydrolase domain-containing protein n=1 Tax=Frankia sp. Cr2 TaxID=3073932 RepID=UPI002AD33586|nr:SGNH hydrolase domain-containing protein [Frankia sp. Cr2]